MRGGTHQENSAFPSYCIIASLSYCIDLQRENKKSFLRIMLSFAMSSFCVLPIDDKEQIIYFPVFMLPYCPSSIHGCKTNKSLLFISFPLCNNCPGPTRMEEKVQSLLSPRNTPVPRCLIRLRQNNGVVLPLPLTLLPCRPVTSVV